MEDYKKQSIICQDIFFIEIYFNDKSHQLKNSYSYYKRTIKSFFNDLHLRKIASLDNGYFYLYDISTITRKIPTYIDIDNNKQQYSNVCYGMIIKIGWNGSVLLIKQGCIYLKNSIKDLNKYCRLKKIYLASELDDYNLRI